MKKLEGLKSKIAAALLALGGIGLLLSGEAERGVELLVAGLAVFGLADKIERKLPE